MKSYYVDGARQLNAIGNVIRIEYVNIRRDGEQITAKPTLEVVMTLANFESFKDSINELHDKLIQANANAEANRDMKGEATDTPTGEVEDTTKKAGQATKATTKNVTGLGGNSKSMISAKASKVTKAATTATKNSKPAAKASRRSVSVAKSPTTKK